MSTIPSMPDMLKAGVHFGHQKSRWHPKMEPYLFGVRNGVHVIDLDKTVIALERSMDHVRTLASKGKVVLFVGTKRQARDIIKAAAESCGMPYITERWIGGLLTNFDEFKRRMKKYKGLKEMFATGEIEKYTKKEQVSFEKEVEKLDRYLAGLVSLEKIPDAIYIADLRVEKTAVMEAVRTKIAMIAVCDSNVDPTKVEFPIPANDDAVNSIKLIADLVASAISEGKANPEKPVVKEETVMTADKSIVAKSMVEKTVSKPRRALKKEVSV